MRGALLEAAAILLAAVAAGLLTNAIRADGIALGKGRGRAPASAFEQLILRSRGAIREIGLEEAVEAHERGVLFLDARSPAEFAAGHVPGARNLYFALAAYASELVPELDPAREIVVYCQSSSCNESRELARALYESGFKAIFHLHDGYLAWESAGLPVAVGGE